MITKKICIDSMDKITSFVKIINEYHGRFDLVSGSCRVNAKSVMGIFNLDISRPVELYIYNEDHADYIVKALSPYIVNPKKANLAHV